MTSLEKSPWRERSWLLLPGAAALACVAVALVPTDALISWFSHPQRDPLPETTRTGAALTRGLALVAATALVVVPVVLERLVPRGRASAPLTEDETPSARRREAAALAGLLVAGLLVRLSRLGESLWYDEIAAWREYGQHGPGSIIGNYFDPSNHVLHTLLTWASVAGLGADEIGLRLPALLFSLAAIIATWGLVRCVATSRAALLAAALMALLPVPVLEGVEARGYSMMMCFAALATWALCSIRRDERASKWCAYAGLCALGAWAHPVTVFVPIGHSLWLGWRGGRGETPFMLRGGLAMLLSAALMLALYAPTLPDLVQLRRTFSAATGDGPGLFGVEGLHGVLQLGGSWSWGAASAGLVLLAWGGVGLVREARGRELVALGLLGLPAMVLVIVLAGTWAYARFALFALPGALAITGIGLDRLWRERRGAGLAGLLVLLGAGGLDLVTRPPKQPLRDAATFVQAAAAAGERVVVIGLRHQVLDA
ncbi:MAG: glycosyltransferase family 39 protein, partial [Planctomycetota bacterium]